MARSCILPEHTKPADLAKHLGVSERELRRFAREIGSCRVIGKEMILLTEDVDLIMEAARPCDLKSTGAAASGTSEGPLPEGDYGDLRRRLTEKPPKGSRRKSRAAPGSVVSMGRGQG